MSSIPHRVSRAKVIAFLRDLGIDTTDLKSLSIDACRVEVVLFRRNEDGNHYTVSPNEVATETVTMTLDGGA